MIQKLYTDAVIPSSSFQYLPSLWLNIFIYFDSVDIILNDTKYFFTVSGIKF